MLQCVQPMYLVKPEAEKQRTIQALLQVVEAADPHMPCITLLRKVINTVEGMRYISAQEAAWVMLRQPLFVGTKKIVHVNVFHPMQQSATLNINAERNSPFEESKIILNYRNRPSELEPITLYQWARKWVVIPK